jgi:hypothetical protein
MVSSLSALLPTKSGRGTILSVSLSLTPPWLMMAQIERRRCWFNPMRPVTPFMTIPTECVLGLSMVKPY